MSRIRSVKPDFWSSEQVLALSRDARLLFIGIWNFADDTGRFKLNPTTIKAQVFPGDDDATRERMIEWLSSIVRRSLVEAYTNDRCLFGHVTGWKKHQRIDRPQPPKHPGPFDNGSVRRTFDEFSTLVRGELSEPSPTDRIGSEGKGSERKGGEEAPVGAPLGPGHFQTFRDTLAAEAMAAGWKPPPELTHTQLRQAAGRAQKHALESGKDYAEACAELARSGLAMARTRRLSPGLALLDCEPGKAPRGRSGRVERAPATTGADFADAEPVEVQLERLGKRR